MKLKKLSRLRQFKSLKARLLVWILIPSLLIILADALLIYDQAKETAILVEDNLLLASAKVISQRVRFDDNYFEIITPPAAFEMLADEFRDKVFFSVRDKSGFLIAGNNDLKQSSRVNLNQSQDAYFSTVGSAQIRVVEFFYQIPNSESDYVITTVAKTLGSYIALRNHLFWNTAKLHLILLIILMTSLSLALKWTLKPINQLADELTKRSPRDLKPFRIGDTPEELLPVITSINDYVLRLKKNSSAYEAFLQNSAHHLRTSYAIINAEIDIALRNLEPKADSNLFITNLKRQVAAGVKIVNDLLMLASVEKANDSGSFSNGKKDVINVSRLLISLLEEFAPVAFQKDIVFNIRELDETVELKEATILVEELISNLIDNAIQHSPRGSEITLSLNNTGASIRLQIIDNGNGIPAEEMLNVFQRFYRLDSAKSGSSGLGLSIAKEICELIGATITLSDPEIHSGLKVEIHFNAHQSSTISH